MSDKKYIFVVTPGRSGSTLITHLLSSSLPNQSISQEGSDKLIPIIEYYLKHNNKLPEKLKLVKKTIKSVNAFRLKTSKKSIKNPHYNYRYKKIKTKNLKKAKNIQELLNQMFSCSDKIVGAKIQNIDLKDLTGPDRYLYLVNNIPNLYIIFHTRNPEDWLASRIRVFKKKNETINDIQNYINKVKLIQHPQIFHSSHETVVEDAYLILKTLNVKTTKEKLNKLKQIECSYNNLLIL